MTPSTPREIGGYFEWEMPNGVEPLHPSASMLLKSARTCLGLLVERERPRRLYVPYYICDEAIELVDPSSTEIVFYGLDEALELADEPALGTDERLLYLNYFGLKAGYVATLERRFGDRLWIDDVQAFHHVPVESPAAHFNSARKFVGVPDGAYLYLPESMQERFADVDLPANEHYVLDHLTMRLEGRTQDGRAAFRENDDLSGGAMTAVSAIGAAMLARIDYAAIARARRENYAYVHQAIGAGNRLPSRVTDLPGDAVPYAYPYLPDPPIAREPFWAERIYVPVLWGECADRIADGFEHDKRLAAHVLPLPIDQRYGPADLDRMIALVRELGGG